MSLREATRYYLLTMLFPVFFTPHHLTTSISMCSLVQGRIVHEFLSSDAVKHQCAERDAVHGDVGVTLFHLGLPRARSPRACCSGDFAMAPTFDQGLPAFEVLWDSQHDPAQLPAPTRRFISSDARATATSFTERSNMPDLRDLAHLHHGRRVAAAATSRRAATTPFLRLHSRVSTTTATATSARSSPRTTTSASPARSP